MHVKDLHEAKLVENCAGGNYLQWQSLLLDLTCSIHPDFTWGFNPPLACTPATDRVFKCLSSEGIEASAKIESLFSTSYISKNLAHGGCAAVTN